MGILSYELLFGEPPFTASTHEETYRRILAAEPTFRCKGGKGEATGAAQDFICALLKRRPSERPYPAEVALHRWLRQDPLEKCSCTDSRPDHESPEGTRSNGMGKHQWKAADKNT